MDCPIPKLVRLEEGTPSHSPIANPLRNSGEKRREEEKLGMRSGWDRAVQPKTAVNRVRRN